MTKHASVGRGWLFAGICLCTVSWLVSCVEIKAQKIEFELIPREIIQNRLTKFSRKDAERLVNLGQIFEGAGCQGERLTEQRVKGSRLPNLVCTLPGQSDSMIMVGAHFDFTGMGSGVVDNWTGASLLASLYESLRKTPRRHTFVFVAFTDEEKGLRGSAFFAKQLASEGSGKARAMVNMDTLGLSSTKIWFSRADPKLAAAIARVAAATKLPLQAVNIEQVGSTDSESFSRHKIPTITIHSLTQETLDVPHSMRDNLKAVQFDHYYDTYLLVASYLAYLDVTLEE